MDVSRAAMVALGSWVIGRSCQGFLGLDLHRITSATSIWSRKATGPVQIQGRDSTRAGTAEMWVFGATFADQLPHTVLISRTEVYSCVAPKPLLFLGPLF